MFAPLPNLIFPLLNQALKQHEQHGKINTANSKCNLFLENNPLYLCVAFHASMMHSCWTGKPDEFIPIHQYEAQYIKKVVKNTSLSYNSSFISSLNIASLKQMPSATIKSKANWISILCLLSGFDYAHTQPHTHARMHTNKNIQDDIAFVPLSVLSWFNFCICI